MLLSGEKGCKTEDVFRKGSYEKCFVRESA
jgi:hypothetical protein